MDAISGRVVLNIEHPHSNFIQQCRRDVKPLPKDHITHKALICDVQSESMVSRIGGGEESLWLSELVEPKIP